MIGNGMQRRANAQFLALQSSPPISWDASAVEEFHEVIATLEAAYSVDLGSFRIPDSQMKPRVLSVRRAPYGGRFPGEAQMSRELYCDTNFALRKVQGIMSYFQDFKPQPEPQKLGVQGNALKLLKAIYEATHDQSYPIDDVTTLQVGLTEEEAKAAFRYLSDRALVETFGIPYAARINANGVDAIERARNYPDQRTGQFPTVTYKNVYNTVHVGSMTNSPFQQAGAHAAQTQTIDYSDQQRAEHQRLVAELTAHLGELGIDARQKQKAEANIATLQAQLSDAEPDPVIIKQAGHTLRNVLEGSIGSLLATAAQPTVWHWIQQTLAGF